MSGLGDDNLGGMSLVGATGLVGVMGLAILERRRQVAVRRDGLHSDALETDTESS
ncbi:hypothetical protein ACQ4M4_27210 [Leptolyngbya sp. AN02str]|uniref:hypothetical protein n=1 Tax=Leptolyngbya sp. AN02str TaxID=3423363 RepID=UPI003D312D52